MAKNPILMKKSVEAAGNRILKSVRLPQSLISQVDLIAAEKGLTFSDVVVNAIEKGLLRESILDLVRLSTAKVEALTDNADLVAQVLGDIATGVDNVKTLVQQAK